ncbi:MAG: tail fiber protein [Comamonas sp.]|nr:tail fiber protein [Candidatus Comamonas equi]
MNISQTLTAPVWIKRAAATAILGVTSIGSAQACGEDYVGAVCVVGFNFCPYGTLPMDGRQVSIQDYQALYAVIGQTYGGNGQSTFALPDMRGRMPVGMGQGPGLTPVMLGQKDGAEAVALTASNLPPLAVHVTGTATGTVSLPLTNTAITGQSITGAVSVKALNGDTAPAGGANIPSSTNNTVGKTGLTTNFYPQGTSPVAVPSSHDLAVAGGTVSGTAAGNVSLPVTVTAALPGGNTAVKTIAPRQAFNFCIVTDGIFPSRP